MNFGMIDMLRVYKLTARNEGRGYDPSDNEAEGSAPRVKMKGEPSNMSAESEDGASMVGRWLEVFWPEDDEWYRGEVTGLDAGAGTHTISYDDGQIENIKLSEETVRWVNRPDPNPASEASFFCTVICEGEKMVPYSTNVNLRQTPPTVNQKIIAIPGKKNKVAVHQRKNHTSRYGGRVSVEGMPDHSFWFGKGNPDYTIKGFYVTSTSCAEFVFGEVQFDFSSSSKKQPRSAKPTEGMVKKPRVSAECSGASIKMEPGGSPSKGPPPTTDGDVNVPRHGDVLIDQVLMRKDLRILAKNVVALASATPDLSTLVTAIQSAGLLATLEGAGPFTVFAPTNEAFAKLHAPYRERLFDPKNVAEAADVPRCCW